MPYKLDWEFKLYDWVQMLAQSQDVFMTIEQDNVETRKRRALYRSNYRGTKEMDIMIGRYAKAVVPEMTEERLGLFENFLSVPDRDLEGWIMRNEYQEDGEYVDFVNEIRKFHGLEN